MEQLTKEDQHERIAKALDIAEQLGGVDGAHHKTWVIDQMVRALTGCPDVTKTATDYQGEEYAYRAQGESAEYLLWLAAYAEGEDGPDTYFWEIGGAP